MTMALWVIFKLKMNEFNFNFKAGKDAKDVAFRKPVDFKDSNSLFERLIFKYNLL